MSAGDADGIILKVDGGGNVVWATRFGSNKHDYPLGIVSGTAFVTTERTLESKPHRLLTSRVRSFVASLEQTARAARM